MHRKLISTVLAATLAMTSFTAPAQAGDRDTARALAAIAGIAVLGAIINDRNDRKRSQHQSITRQQPYKHNDIIRRAEPRYTDRYVQPRKPRHIDRTVRPLQPKPLPHRVARKLLPGECLRSLRTRQGKVRMFGARCLQNNFSYANRLPAECGIRVRTNNGPRRGYEARCLRGYGYQLARN
jgi:hypothetical protein